MIKDFERKLHCFSLMLEIKGDSVAVTCYSFLNLITPKWKTTSLCTSLSTAIPQALH
jgi:hypothetical protein